MATNKPQPVISKRNNKIVCSHCGYSEIISENTFNKMWHFPWISFLTAMEQDIKMVLVCPKCLEKEEYYFRFKIGG